MNILVAGGAGYIGSHTLVALYKNGHTAIAVDNFINSDPRVLKNVELIIGEAIPFYEIDLRDTEALNKVFSNHKIDGVIHFAGLKAVGDSVKKPIDYYDNNINSTLSLLRCMLTNHVYKIIFSSSATVYGSAAIPYTETEPIGNGVSNPYGNTKVAVEHILQDICISNSLLECISLRYFNPIGAHESGLIGENPRGVPNNIMPYITQVAAKKRSALSIYGHDYATPDGTCIRDYIHVMDLAEAHILALENLKPGYDAINLGMGRGISVLELISIFCKATGVEVPYKFTSRRNGDLPEFYAKTDKATSVLGWQPRRTISQACADAWRWETK